MGDYDDELFLYEIRPKSDEIIFNSFKRSYLFPKTLLWLNDKSKKLSFVLTLDLIKKLNYSYLQAKNILERFVMCELLIKKKVNNKNQYWFITGKNDKTLEKYVPCVQKNLF